MKTQNTCTSFVSTSFVSLANLSSYAIGAVFVLGASLSPTLAHAANNAESTELTTQSTATTQPTTSSQPIRVASLDPQLDTQPETQHAARPTDQPNPPFAARWNNTPTNGATGAVGAESNAQQSAHSAIEGKYSGWSLNFTPVLLMPRNDERLGGGADPELKYTVDRGNVRLSAGLRVGAYYAKNLFGITAMPTLRLVVPVGPVEPYVSFGMGYGWLPKVEHSGIATMSRLGVVFRFSERFALGAEGTLQRIERSAFEFPSFGSALSLNF